MPSLSLNRWQTERRQALDQIEAAHRAVGGAGPGRRYATQQINQAYAMLLSSQFQGYCRDLHSESVDHVCGPIGAGGARMILLRIRLTEGRKLDTGNPNPGNIGNDFWFFDFDLWDAVYTRDIQNRDRRRHLEMLNAWRNAIGHQDFDPLKLGGRVTVRLADVRRWRRACEGLAVEFDAVVADHLRFILGAAPW
jgi:hypothetical protein